MAKYHWWISENLWPRLHRTDEQRNQKMFLKKHLNNGIIYLNSAWLNLQKSTNQNLCSCFEAFIKFSSELFDVNRCKRERECVIFWKLRLKKKANPIDKKQRWKQLILSWIGPFRVLWSSFHQTRWHSMKKTTNSLQ